MSFIYLIPLVIFFVVLYLKKYKFEKNNFINIIFCGLLCELCSLLLSHFVFRIPKSYQYIFPILYYFFIAGIPEEISKYTMIKLSFPKDKKSIFVNSILISFIFMSLAGLLFFFCSNRIELDKLFRNEKFKNNSKKFEMINQEDSDEEENKVLGE